MNIPIKLSWWSILGILFYAIYACGVILRIVSKFFLAISYYLTLDIRKANDIMKSIFIRPWKTRGF